MNARLVALAILDIVVLAWCGIAGVPAGWALAAHAILSALGYAAWLYGGRALGVSPAVLGVLGPAAILVSQPIGRRIGAGRARTADDMFGLARPSLGTSGAGRAVPRLLDGRVHHPMPETLGSLVTILRHGDVAARRRALETAVRSFEPALSPLIALALTDADQTIRALAAAASARVGQNLAIARAGGVAEDKVADAWLSLAALLADHARADVLLSDTQRAHLRDDAVATLAASAPDHRLARDQLAIEAMWAAGDYDTIDLLAASMPDTHERRGRDAPAMASWWRTGATA